MSHQGDPPDSSNSLLRRMLDDEENHEARAPDRDVPVPPSNHAAEAGVPLSPIRPQVDEQVEPRAPLTPSVPEKADDPPPEPPLTPREQLQRAEEALIRLREKMAETAAEFADGVLNQAQFNAIYARYSEQRDITERLLMRDPGSQAWQSVVQSGHTTFLKEHYAARVLSYSLYDQASFELITVTGPVQIRHSQVEAVLRRLTAVRDQRGNPGPAHRQLDDERYVLFVPGDISTAVVIFTREPSARQVARVQDIHRDFERANRHALQSGDYEVERLVFPHRALFEERP